MKLLLSTACGNDLSAPFAGEPQDKVCWLCLCRTPLVTPLLTYRHDTASKQVEEASHDRVETTFIESVNQVLMLNVCSSKW